jgi:hypothetical protein
MAFIKEAWPAIYDRTYKFLNALDYMNLRPSVSGSQLAAECVGQ